MKAFQRVLIRGALLASSPGFLGDEARVTAESRTIILPSNHQRGWGIHCRGIHYIVSVLATLLS